MFKRNLVINQPTQQGTVGEFQAYDGRTPFYPMGILNGYLTRRQNRLSPETDADHAPREFRRFVNASGAQDVQINNGLQRRIGSGFRPSIQYVDWLYASNPQIPGQMRPDRSGNHKKGIDPLSYSALFQNGPGSQPKNPGGPGQIVGNTFFNPGTS